MNRAFAEYEDANIGVTENTWNKSNLYVITFQDTLNMMGIDALYLLVLAWYVNQVWPSEFGTHKPWYFLFTPLYWWHTMYEVFSCFGLERNLRHNFQAVHNDAHAETADTLGESTVEPVPESLRKQIVENNCVEIKSLYKCFETTNGTKVAVDSLSLTMFTGQITALLGHNGAGKSTAIAMLTGLYPADGGDALIEGYSINYEMHNIRRNLGVCPQHDILFPDLTVEEHLSMFAAFKGTPRNQLRDEVEKMIQSVGLTEKRHARSKTLSGGQKRKLSVGIAFIGGSRVVFLDEPTSGMDPYSRRFTWNIIRQQREGRIICLTTHFMVCFESRLLLVFVDTNACSGRGGSVGRSYRHHG